MTGVPTVGEGEIWPTGNLLQPLTDCAGGNSCAGVLYQGGLGTFLVLMLVIGGGCAIMSGRSVARGWGQPGLAMFYGVLLALAVQFLHFGLLRGTLLSPYYFALDAIILMALAYAGYSQKLAGQMVTQYPWLYRRAGPFGWAPVEPSQ